MDDQPTDGDMDIDRDRVAREEGLEHTGGLGELEGAGTAGGAEVGPTPADEDLGPLDNER